MPYGCMACSSDIVRQAMSEHRKISNRWMQGVSKAYSAQQQQPCNSRDDQLVPPGKPQRALRQKGQAWNSYSSSVLAGRLNVATPSPTNPAVPSRTSAGNAEVANCVRQPCRM